MTTYLVQNIETFETITTFASQDAFDSWMSESSVYGIVSLDTDADGEYDYVALVAPIDGPDYDMNDVPQEQIVAMLTQETKATITPPKPRKARKTKTKTKSRTKAKGAKMQQPKKIRNFEILCAFIEKYPGVSRTDVFLSLIHI